MALAGSSQLISSHEPTAPESFKYETKAVVLNFMGLVSNTTSLGGSSSSSSGDIKHALRSQASYSSVDSGPPMLAPWNQSLTDLPEFSMMEKFDPHEHSPEDDPGRLHRQPTVDLDSPRSYIGSPAFRHSVQEDDQVDYPEQQHHHQNSISAANLQGPMSKSPKKSPMFKRKSMETQDHHVRLSHLQKSRSVARSRVTRPQTLPGLPTNSGDHSREEGNAVENSVSDGPISKNEISSTDKPALAERQDSEISGVSNTTQPISDDDDSLMASGLSLASATSSFISVRTCDVEGMVRSHGLPQTALTLRDELTKEWDDLERSKAASHVSSPDETDARAMTPETEVAEYLRVIGDRVNAQYGQELDQATHDIMQMPREKITYDILRGLCLGFVRQTTGWTRVAMFLLLGQRLAWSLLSRGERGISELVDYMARLIEDNMAEFIISRGGWHSIAEEKELCTPMSTADLSAAFPSTAIETPSSELSHYDSAVSTNDQATDTPTVIERDQTNESLASLVSAVSSLPAKSSDDGIDMVDLPKPDGLPLANPLLDMVDQGIQADFPPDDDISPECNTGEVSQNIASEIGFYRQASVQLSEELHNNRRRADWLSFSLGVAGVSVISIAAYFAYRRLTG